MNRILIIGNTGLDNKNNSTSIRMRGIFESLNENHSITFDYYKLRNATLKVKYIKYLNDKPNSNPIKAFLSIRKLKNDYTLSIAETFNASIVSYLYYIFTGTPYIWRQFGTTFNDEFTFKNYFSPKFIIKYFLHKIIANSKGCLSIVCTEDGCANRALFLEKLKIDYKKLYLVKNQRPKIENKINANKINKNFNLIQIGRINSWKKIHLVLESIANLKKEKQDIGEKICFNIIGQTQDKHYEKQLTEFIKENNLEKQVFFYKDLEYPQIEKLLKNSDLAISLTAYNPIVESLQNSVPCITYNYGEVKEIFEDTEAVIILCPELKKSTGLTTDDEKMILNELKDSIEELYKIKDLLPYKGEMGRKFIENNFPTLEEHILEVSNIYLKSYKENLK